MTEDRRRTRHAKTYGSRHRIVPCPKGHDVKPGLEALAEIGRRFLAAQPKPVSPAAGEIDDLPLT